MCFCCAGIWSICCVLLSVQQQSFFFGQADVQTISMLQHSTSAVLPFALNALFMEDPLPQKSFSQEAVDSSGNCCRALQQRAATPKPHQEEYRVTGKLTN
jgi:hypothetical protein